MPQRAAFCAIDLNIEIGLAGDLEDADVRDAAVPGS